MSHKQQILEKLKSILNEQNIKNSRMLLFGSRARGDFREGSDWDIMIILEKPVDARTKKEIWFDIYRKLHEYYPFISFDLILKTAETFDEEKTIANTISNEVYLEGVEA